MGNCKMLIFVCTLNQNTLLLMHAVMDVDHFIGGKKMANTLYSYQPS